VRDGGPRGRRRGLSLVRRVELLRWESLGFGEVVGSFFGNSAHQCRSSSGREGLVDPSGDARW
jgi:hypothetical protein